MEIIIILVAIHYHIAYSHVNLVECLVGLRHLREPTTKNPDANNMKKTILVAMFGALALSASAGDWNGKSVVDDKEVIVGCPDTRGSVTVAYVTDYILHGARINRDTVALDVNYTFGSAVPITLGVSHFAGINAFNPVFNPIFGALDETDVYLSAVIAEVGGFSVVTDYTHRFFSNSIFGSIGELGLTLRRDVGFADFFVGSDFAMNPFAGGNGWVHRAGLEKEIGITDSVGLLLGATVGYHDGYFVNNSGWSDYNLEVALPISLNCNTTLTPFVAYNGVQQWNQFALQGDALYGGISLNVKF